MKSNLKWKHNLIWFYIALFEKNGEKTLMIGRRKI